MDALWFAYYLDIIFSFSDDMRMHGKTVCLLMRKHALAKLENTHVDDASMRKSITRLKDLEVLTDYHGKEEADEDVVGADRLVIAE